MKKLTAFTALLILSVALAFSQPVIQWQNTIGGNLSEANAFVQETADSGFIVGGTSRSAISGDKTENAIGGSDYWIVKLDISGNIQWQNTIGGSNNEVFRCIQQTTDGGYILGGFSNSPASGDKTEGEIGGTGQDDYWVIKLDASGSIQWQNTIGGTESDRLLCLQQTADGGYILGGYSYSGIGGDKTEICLGLTDYWVVKINSSGAVQWDNTIGGSSTDYVYAIDQTTDGGYFIAGTSESNISVDKTENSVGAADYWVLKLDASGNIQWQNTIGGTGLDDLASAQQTTDGGYIIGGRSSSDSSGDKTEDALYEDYWIVKLDASGTILWDNTIGGAVFDNLHSLQQTTDGGYILAGESNSNISGDKTENSMGQDDYWIVKVDGSGNILWQNTIGGSDYDRLYSIKQTADGGYIVGGASGSPLSGDKTENSQGDEDYWIIRLTTDTITSVQAFNFQASLLYIFPNPANESVVISSEFGEKNNAVLTITDLSGNLVLRETLRTPNSKLLTSFLPKGMYIVKVYNDNGIFQQKLVIQ